MMGADSKKKKKHLAIINHVGKKITDQGWGLPALETRYSQTGWGRGQ